MCRTAATAMGLEACVASAHTPQLGSTSMHQYIVGGATRHRQALVAPREERQARTPFYLAQTHRAGYCDCTASQHSASPLVLSCTRSC